MPNCRIRALSHRDKRGCGGQANQEHRQDYQSEGVRRGSGPVIVDALDPDSVADVVAKAEPEVIVHQATALKGVRKVVAQSNYALVERTGGPVVDESGRIEPNPPADAKEGVEALRHLEEAVTGITWADGIVLRYGGFYGPGTGIEAAPDAVMAELIRKRRFPIVGGGGGGGVWSLVHITYAASATVAAIERGKSGIYHVADDEPAPVREVLLELARVLGAKPPHRVPAWPVRMLAGETAVYMMTQARGISSEKTKRELGWTLQYPSWRAGFAEGLS
jgi:nucleoside-diphosphate-sugar epimerase